MQYFLITLVPRPGVETRVKLPPIIFARSDIDDMGVPKARRNEVVLLLMGVYYGMVNHYLLHNMKFDVKKMKKEFAAYMNKILTVEGVK